MRLACFCACGATLVGHATPGSAATALEAAFRTVHNRPGCGPATRDQARAARRRADRREAIGRG